MDVRFLCDRNLGKLVKWLRILGYDTLWDRGDADQGFLRKAGGEGRIALTRKRNLGVSGSGRLIVVKADRVEGTDSRDPGGPDHEAGSKGPDDPLSALQCDAGGGHEGRSGRSGPCLRVSKQHVFQKMSDLQKDLLAGNACEKCRGNPQDAHSDSSPLIFSMA